MTTRALAPADVTPEQLARIKQFVALAREAEDIEAMARDSRRSAEADLAKVLSDCIAAGDTLTLPDLRCRVMWMQKACGGEVVFTTAIREGARA